MFSAFTVYYFILIYYFAFETCNRSLEGIACSEISAKMSPKWVSLVKSFENFQQTVTNEEKKYNVPRRKYWANVIFFELLVKEVKSRSHLCKISETLGKIIYNLIQADTNWCYIYIYIYI